MASLRESEMTTVLGGGASGTPCFRSAESATAQASDLPRQSRDRDYFGSFKKASLLVLDQRQPRAGSTAAEAGKLSASEGVVNFVISCVGAGMVVYPRIMADNGWLQGISVLLFSALASFESGSIILECCELSEVLMNKPRGSVTTYEEVALTAYGTRGQAFLAVTKNFYMLGSVLVYGILLTEVIHDLFKWDMHLVRWLLVFPLMVALSMITSLKSIAPLAPLGAFAVALQALSICVGSVWAFGGRGFVRTMEYRYFNFDLHTLGSSLAVCTFGYDAIQSLPSFRSQLARAEDGSSSTGLGCAFVTIICLGLMVCGYLGYGDSVAEDVLDNLHMECTGLQCVIAIACSISMIVSLVFTVPLDFFVVISFLESSTRGGMSIQLSVLNMALRAGLMVLLVIVGSLVPFVLEVLGLVSALFGSFNGMFFPLAFSYKLRASVAASHPGSHALVSTTPLRLFKQLVILTAGVVALVFGTAGAGAALRSKIQGGA